jgi:hypothetical protein
LQDGHAIPGHAQHLNTPAGAGSLLLEFGLLSRLTRNVSYERAARTAIQALWRRRSPETGLVPASIDVMTGYWTTSETGIGSSLDSFYEYMLKGALLFGEAEGDDDNGGGGLLETFKDAYAALQMYVRVPHGFWYAPTDADSGRTLVRVVDSLGAFFPGLQVRGTIG